MRVLITGVGGFCGAHLVDRLRREPNVEIAGFGVEAESQLRIRLDQYLEGDITDLAVVTAAVKEFRPDMLFHLAGLSGNSASPSRMYAVNVNGAVNLLEALRANAPDCASVFVGSAAEYGKIRPSALPVSERTPCRPIGPYGVSKYAATFIALDYAHRYRMKVSVVRPFNIIGPGIPENLLVGALIARAQQALASGDLVVKIGDMNSKRDFVAASDAIDAYLRIAKSGFSGRIFNICSGRSHSIRHVAKMLLANSPRPIALEFDPNLVPASPVRNIYGTYQKAARAVGFRPSTSLEAVLKEAWVSKMAGFEQDLLGDRNGPSKRLRASKRSKTSGSHLEKN
jgi:GDP-4-dehydro-6-deoxy-D-mannose reductase